jgi:glucose/mannose-6-phosphate isomerase
MRNVEYKIIKSIDGNILSKITNLIYTLDYSTIYTAIMKDIDPSPVNSIDFIKSRL